MPAFFQGKQIGFVGALTEPSTYDADLTPVDMQLGRTAYVKGEKITGTGKCFEFAEYGLRCVKMLSNGFYGVSFELDKGANTFFVASTGTGDIVIQTSNGVDTGDEPTKIGENLTTSGDVFAVYNDSQLLIYTTDIASTNTRWRIFVGKDNEV